MSNQIKAKTNPIYFLHLAIVLVLMFCFRFIPPILTFTTEGMAVIGVLIGGIYGFIFLDVSLTSLIGVVALGCTGIMNSTGVIAAGFGE